MWSWLPFEIGNEIPRTDEFLIYADDQTEQVHTVVVGYLLLALVMLTSPEPLTGDAWLVQPQSGPSWRWPLPRFTWS